MADDPRATTPFTVGAGGGGQWPDSHPAAQRHPASISQFQIPRNVRHVHIMSGDVRIELEIKEESDIIQTLREQLALARGALERIADYNYQKGTDVADIARSALAKLI